MATTKTGSELKLAVIESLVVAVAMTVTPDDVRTSMVSPATIAGSLAAVQIFTAFIVPLSLIALSLLVMSRRRLEKALDASRQLQERKA